MTPDPDPDDKNPESGNQKTEQNSEQEASKTDGLSAMSIVWLCIGGVLLFASVFGIVYFITQKKQK